MTITRSRSSTRPALCYFRKRHLNIQRIWGLFSQCVRMFLLAFLLCSILHRRLCLSSFSRITYACGPNEAGLEARTQSLDVICTTTASDSSVFMTKVLDKPHARASVFCECQCVFSEFSMVAFASADDRAHRSCMVPSRTLVWAKDNVQSSSYLGFAADGCCQTDRILHN